MAEDFYRFVREDMRAGPAIELLLEVANELSGWAPILNDRKDNIVGFSADVIKWSIERFFNQKGPVERNYSVEIYKPGEDYRICLKDDLGIVADYISPAVKELYTKINEEFQRKLDSDFWLRACEANNALKNFLEKRDRVN